MKTLKITLVVLATAVILVGTAFLLINYFKPKLAGIYVSTSPSSSVYINGGFLGKTPFQNTLEAGLVTIRLVPDTSDKNLLPFETKLTFTPGIQTVVRREFGKSEDESSGDIISFEKDLEGNTGLIVISTPDNAQVSVDGVSRGFAPYKTSSISPAEHQITVRAAGFTDRILTVSTKKGFRLVLFAKLAKVQEESLATPTPAPAPQYFVVILSTPTGYLRVRTQPGTSGEEIGQVNPGNKFLYLETDSKTGWFEIQFEEPKPGLPNGIVGWISNQFAKVVDVSGNSVPLPIAPSPTP